MASLLNKNLEKGTRGTVYGVFVAVSSVGNLTIILIFFIGLLIISKGGGYLFESVSIYGPFVFVGFCDVAYIIAIIGLKIAGKFK